MLAVEPSGDPRSVAELRRRQRRFMRAAVRKSTRVSIAAGAMALLSTPLVPAASAAPRSAALWSIQATPNHPGSRENLLFAVSCPVANRCEAVGGWFGPATQVPYLLAEGWNGNRWSLEPTPKPPGSAYDVFYGVSCPSATACTAVGNDSNGMVGETWNGRNWSLQPGTNPSRAYATVLRAVSCTAATSCTAVGSYSVVPNNGGAAVDHPLAETWNGTSWTIEPTPDPAGAAGAVLRGVSCLSATWCIAVGSYQKKSGNAYALSEVWNGSRWSNEATRDPAGSTNTVLDGVDCRTATACTATGLGPNGYTLVEIWNGTWSIQPSPTPDPGTDFLPSVSCPTTSVCVAAGDSQPSSISGSTFAERRTGPTAWTVQATPTPPGSGLALFEGISCSGPTACTAVGYYAAASGLVTFAERYGG